MVVQRRKVNLIAKGTAKMGSYLDYSVLSNFFKFPYDIEGMPTDDPAKAVIEITCKSIYGDQWKLRSDLASPIAS